MNTTKEVKIIIAVAIVCIGISFYGGMKYGQISGAQSDAAGFRQGLGAGQGGAGRMGGNRAGFPGGAGGGANGANFASGEILSVDAQSVTVKMRDGGSKIVFYSPTTEITKFASGTSADLKVGENITVNGKANTDGSVTAQTIQMRPAMPVVPVSVK